MSKNKTKQTTKNKKKTLIQTSKLPSEKMTWQGALRLLQNRVFKIRTPRGHGTGFHIGNFGSGNRLYAITTAYHVINQCDDWGEPLKVIHAQTGKEILIKEKDRALFTYPNKDLAVILFVPPDDFSLPNNQIDRIPSGSSLVSGVDVAWCGFPAIKNDTLCFFHGHISCYLDQQGDYLIDGVAINGVSGGPVFYIDNKTNMPKVAGVITAYIANRATKETLPGLSMITSIAPCEDTIRNLMNINQAKKEAGEQKAGESNSGSPKNDKSVSSSKNA